MDAKISLEASGLLFDKHATRVFVSALRLDNSWLSDSALRACRNLKAIDRVLEEMLRRYLGEIKMPEVIRRADEIRFSLSLSEGFRHLQKIWWFRILDARIALLALFASVLVSPIVGILGIFGILYLPYFRVDFPRRMAEMFWRMNSAAIMLFPLIVLAVGPKDKLRGSYLIDPLVRVFGTHHIYMICGIHVLLAALLFPTCQFFFRGKAFRQFALISIPSAALPAMSLFILSRFYPRLAHIILMCLVSATIAITVVMFFILVYQNFGLLTKWRNDRSAFKVAVQSDALSRAIIATDFCRFETEWYRERYVFWLRNLTSEPLGDWPDRRPNFDNDKASTLLAQLDEHWLGLDS